MHLANHGAHRARAGIPDAERGAVLYIALIILIMLTLIGLVGMQVAGMQERMTSNFRAANIAFQSAEALVRNAECALENIENRTSLGGCTAVTPGAIERRCDLGYQALGWANARSLSDGSQVNVRQIDQCIQGQSSVGMGQPMQDNPFPVYQVTGYATDAPGGTQDSTSATSAAVVDTIFRL